MDESAKNPPRYIPFDTTTVYSWDPHGPTPLSKIYGFLLDYDTQPSTPDQSRPFRTKSDVVILRISVQGVANQVGKVIEILMMMCLGTLDSLKTLQMIVC